MVRGTPKHVVGYLKDFLFDENQARSPVSALSGGEKARLLLARLMAKESNLLVLDEPTNDLDVETLDLLQEILDGYDGTVLLVSHDRDFLDRVATSSVVIEGGGNTTIYAGGWSNYQSQKKAVAKSAKSSKKSSNTQTGKKKAKSSSKKMSFKDEHRLKELPSVLERLEAEIRKLTDYLSDPELYTLAPVKFQKASEALAERHDALDKAEIEWLELEERVVSHNS